MYRILGSSALVGLAAAGTPAAADTLRDALARAYRDNPTITASRAQQRATDETVPILKADGRPSLSGGANYNDALRRTGNALFNAPRQVVVSTTASLPLYRGGAVRNSVRAAETRVEGGQAGVRNTEATTFTDVVAAYNNVIRDEAIVGLNTQNVRVLDTNLRATRDRFQVGDVTRTDVAQSEARLSLARAQLQSAEANLIASREDYVRLVGTAPGALDPPPPLPNLPTTPDDAVTAAVNDNPALIAAQKERDATAYDVRVAQASRLPSVDLTLAEQANSFLGSLQRGQDFTTLQSGVTTLAGVRVTVPFYQGGRPAAQVRRARALRGQAIENVTATERQVIASARSAYAIWRSSLEVIASSEAAVSANKLSLEGVRAENSVGNRTIIEILNAEQELLNSQVQLVTARRDAYVAGFAVLAAMGQAEARDLGLDGGALYDPVANYRRVRGRVMDVGDGPVPVAVAPTTTGIPAQNATVRRPSDPALKSDVDRTPTLTTGENSPNRNN